MLNKKIASEIAVGIIVLLVIVIGGTFWLQSRKGTSESRQVQSPTQENKNVNMANPASVFCGQNGGKSEIRNNPDSSQTGYCVFANGAECEEWAYYKGECSSAGRPSEEYISMCTQDVRLCADGSYVARTGQNCEFAACSNGSEKAK